MPLCLKVISADGVLMYINPQGLAMIEAQSVDVAGTPYADLWPPKYRGRILAALGRAAAGKIAVVEGYAPTFKGTPKWWETSFYSIRDRDSKIHIVGISHDISNERRFQLQQAIDDERRHRAVEA